MDALIVRRRVDLFDNAGVGSSCGSTPSTLKMSPPATMLMTSLTSSAHQPLLTDLTMWQPGTRE
jgi:hypothetical protein